MQVVPAPLQNLADTRRLGNHSGGLAVNEAGLIPFDSDAKYFSALLTVCDGEVKRNAGSPGTLPVFPRQFNNRRTEASVSSLGVNPSEKNPSQRLLPGFKREFLIGPLAFAVAKELEEVDDPLCFGPVKTKAAEVCVRKIANVTLACKPDQLAGYDLAGDYASDVLIRFALPGLAHLLVPLLRCQP